MSRVFKQYMGDGVYVSFDGYSIWLTTEDGVSVTNTICLEPTVFRKIVRYWPEAKAFVEALRQGMELCGQQGCELPAAYTFIWPGKDERQQCCAGHHATVIDVGNTLGISVHMEAIE